MDLIGDWTDPLLQEDEYKIGEGQYYSLLKQVAQETKGTCQCCGFQMPLSSTDPTGALNLCLSPRESVVDKDNAVTLCDGCVRLNSLDNLAGAGQFVELPWISQSDLTNALRVIYCVQASNDERVHKTRVWQGSNNILTALARHPENWKPLGFDGSPEMVKDTIDNDKGFYQKEGKNSRLYIDRLRFFFHRKAEPPAIERWKPVIETQVIQAEIAMETGQI